MNKNLCAAALCCGIACFGVANGSLSPDSVKELASSLSQVADIGKNLAVVAESSDPESDIQQDYKRIGELYKKLEGTDALKEWEKEHPIYAGWLKLLDWLGN